MDARNGQPELAAAAAAPVVAVVAEPVPSVAQGGAHGRGAEGAAVVRTAGAQGEAGRQASLEGRGQPNC